MQRLVILIALAALLSGCQHDYQVWRPRPSTLANPHLAAWPEASDPQATGSALGKEEAFLRHCAELGADDALRPDPDMFRIRAVTRDGEREQQRVALANDWKLRAWYGHEFAAIAAGSGNQTASRIGLALSGGGVRSASFATGVLRGLHEIGFLREVGYLSTVSGGGWAGYWYLHRCREANRVGAEELGLSSERLAAPLFEPGSLHLGHLAQEGHYLTDTHYSKSVGSLVGKVAIHFAGIPVHWVLNGFFDFDQNIPFLRDFFRDGLGGAFGYRNVHEDEYEALRMSEYVPSDTRHWPYWIINLHLSLEDDDGRYRNRTGDAFELTPHRAGADAVGYVHVPPQTGSSDAWMTDLWGVSVSSAAVDSRSLQTGTLTSMALYALNLNLGTYVDGWNEEWLDGRAPVNHAYYCLTSPWLVHRVLGSVANVVGFGDGFDFGQSLHTTTRDAKRFYLTDGGHFDNTGLYALVRRGCRLIVFSDATHDPRVNAWDTLPNDERAQAFSSFRDVEAKLYADFGTEIEMEWETFDVRGSAEVGFGEGPANGVMLGTIRNLPILDASGDVDAEVKILYVRSAYDLEYQLRRKNTFVDSEKAAHTEFPNDTTADQFYAEQTIQAYRELGRSMILRSRPRFDEALEHLQRRYGGAAESSQNAKVLSTPR